jgi:hypothetical protein
VRWTLGRVGARDALQAALKDEEFSAALNQEHRKAIDEEEAQIHIEVDSSITVADISGDESGVTIVNTRMGTVLAKESPPARLWQVLEMSIARASERKEAHLCMKCLRMSGYYAHWLSRDMRSRLAREFVYFDESEMPFHSSRRRLSKRSFQDQLWSRLATEVNVIIEQYELDGQVPDSPEFLFKEKSFNASDYWRDWHRTKKQKPYDES